MQLKPYHPSVVTDLNILASFKVSGADKSSTVKDYVLGEFSKAVDAFADIATKETNKCNYLDTQLEGEDLKKYVKNYLSEELIWYNSLEVHEMVTYLRDVIEGDCKITLEVYMNFEDSKFSFSIVGTQEQ